MTSIAANISYGLDPTEIVDILMNITPMLFATNLQLLLWIITLCTYSNDAAETSN